MAKKGPKTKKPAGSSKQTADTTGGPPCYTGIGTKGIRLDRARGIPICLDEWTSFGGFDQEPTRISIQEWTGDHWEVIQVIAPRGAALDQALRLDPKNFPGRYLRERVLPVYKPPAKPGP